MQSRQLWNHGRPGSAQIDEELEKLKDNLHGVRLKGRRKRNATVAEKSHSETLTSSISELPDEPSLPCPQFSLSPYFQIGQHIKSFEGPTCRVAWQMG